MTRHGWRACRAKIRNGLSARPPSLARRAQPASLNRVGLNPGTPMLTNVPQLPTGLVLPFAASSIPDGWLECTGQAVSRTSYARLFNLIGTTFGAGDGSTTFNVPDIRGRTPIGVGTGSGLTARSLAGTGGAE